MRGLCGHACERRLVGHTSSCRARTLARAERWRAADPVGPRHRVGAGPDPDLVFDRVRHAVTANGEKLDLTPTEFAILETLMTQAGRAFQRIDLIESAIGDDTVVLERTIDVHIRSLRKKLGPLADLIETVRGVGYRFRDS